MSEQNISNSIDVFMDILNLAFQRYLKHWRENEEINLIQAQMDTVSNHVSVMAYEFHPLEHTLHNVMLSIQNNQVIDLDFVALADKYTTFRYGEELLAKSLALKLGGKKLSWVEFGKIINDVNENPQQLILDYLINSKELDKFAPFIKEGVADGTLSVENAIKFYTLNEEEKVGLTVRSQNDIGKLTKYLAEVDDKKLLDSNTKLFVNQLHKMYTGVLKSENLESKAKNIFSGDIKDLSMNDSKTISKAFVGFDEAFQSEFTKVFLENYYKLDKDGNLLSLEERLAKKEAYENLLIKPYEELTAADRVMLCYFQFAGDENSPLATLSREMSKAVILQNTAFLKNVKHGELYNKFTGDTFTIKYDINGEQYIEGPIKNDLNASGIRDKAVDDFVSSVKGVFEHAESNIQSVAREHGNLNHLAGLNLVEFLKEISKHLPDGERVESGFEWKDHHKNDFIARIRDLTHNLNAMDFKSVILGFEDKRSPDRKWVVPYDIMLDDIKGLTGRLDAFYTSFKNKPEFMMKMWDLDASSTPNMPQSIKEDFEISRSWATMEYIDVHFSKEWLDMKLNGLDIHTNVKNLLIGMAITRNGDDEYTDVLYRHGIDVSDRNRTSQFTQFYKEVETNAFKAKDLFINFERE